MLDTEHVLDTEHDLSKFLDHRRMLARPTPKTHRHYWILMAGSAHIVQSKNTPRQDCKKLI